MVQKLRKTQRQTNMVAVACVTAALLMSLVVGSAQAAALNLVLEDYPDIASFFIETVYTSGTFTAEGIASTLNRDGSIPWESIGGGIFSLSALIDQNGILASGSLSISGALGTHGEAGFFDGTLLTGTLTAFGFQSGSETFEFLFDVTDSYLADLYGGVGSMGGVILANTDFTNFRETWGNTGFAVSDTGTPVPEPATMLLMGIGLIGLVGLKRKKAKK